MTTPTPTERDVIQAADEFADAFDRYRRKHACVDSAAKYEDWVAACQAYWIYHHVREALDNPEDWICSCGCENGADRPFCTSCRACRL